jgi:triacylglycerol lipase
MASPRYPIVLAHGVLGFDELRLRGTRRHYFNGLTQRISLLDSQVYRPQVAMIGSIASRAAQLCEYIRGLPEPKVNVIAHSMGGLDARYAIANLGVAGRIASLITVGTPHRGTPLADLGSGLLGEKLRMRKALALFGVDAGAFYDLTTRRMESFNEENRDAPEVAYASVVGQIGEGCRINPLLRASHRYLAGIAGDNDGIVPASSQAWGEVITTINADHWAEVGWPDGSFAVEELFVLLLRELAGRGL